MKEEMIDKLQKFYYATHNEIAQSIQTFDEWLDGLSNKELIETIDLLGGFA